MKRMLLPPIFVLAALLAFSLWNIRHMEGETDRWREQLQAADRLALSGEWAEALDALWESYDDWSHSQTYLHIVSHHDAVDDAEAMYRRAIAFGETEELSEFHAELSDLRDQLRLCGDGSAEYPECAVNHQRNVTGQVGNWQIPIFCDNTASPWGYNNFPMQSVFHLSARPSCCSYLCLCRSSAHKL